jgi:hypothetical protein
MHARTIDILFSTLAATLACCSLAVLSGCGGAEPTRDQAIRQYSQELREAVATRVPDEQRKARLLQVVDHVEALQLRFTHETTHFIDGYRKLNADYDAARPAFEHLFSDYSARRITARNEALDLHFQLAALTTAAEWEAIGKAEANLYEEINDTAPTPEHPT